MLGGGVLLAGPRDLAGQWSQVSPITPPSARTDATIAYDIGRRTTILFGGFPANANTYAWDGTAWSQVASAGPQALWASAMAYETQQSGLLLFGGKTAAAPIAETWRWSGVQWARVFPVVSPPARYYHAMAYDPVRARIVLFGGDTGSTYLGDTWEWDGTSWLQRAFTGPSPRRGHKLAWDPRRGTVLLFGGDDTGGARADTWEWNGNAWAQLGVSGPLADAQHSMATVGANIALFQSGGALQRTWSWNGSSWSMLTSPSEPAPRSGAAMATDRNGAVLFGGYHLILGYWSDTWTLSLATTRLIVPASAENVEGNSQLPLGSATRRRMQTVIDVASFPANQRTGILHGVHLRRDGIALAFSGRTIDARITLGIAATPPISMSTSFLANWSGTPTLVFQGTVSVPPSLPLPSPAPFQIVFPFGNTFLWNAQNLAIEMEVVGTSLPAQYDLDAVSQPYSGGIVTGVGQACPGSLGPPSLTLPSAANLVIGGAIDIGLTASRPGALAFNFLGDNDTQWAGIPLPFQWPGTSCSVYHNWVVNQLSVVGNDGRARAVYPIPPQTHLSGSRLFSQWGVYEGFASPPLVTTSMARMTIGPVPAVHWDTITNADGSSQGVKAMSAWMTPVLQLDLN